jgi:aspartyl-tRNA(Asn)/glutamyl-tRNA(Gln) amidotransferase subunit A
LDVSRVPGGSSGGSAAAVAANLCHASIGTDTGGSIRQPAAYCGIYGMKPTYGRVSRHGLVAFASSFDQAGPFARSLEDLALITEIISGSDEFDATASERPVPNMQIPAETGKKRFAIIKEVRNSEGLHPEIKAVFERKIEALLAAGHVVEEVSFPYIDYCIPTYYVLTTAEASSNLSRYNGVTYGYRYENAKDLEEMYKKTRSLGFGREVKRRIMLGTFVLSEGYYDAYYSKAQKVRRVLRDSMEEILKEYDVVLLPSTPSFPFQFGAKSTDPIEMYLEDIFTAAANLTGHPAISVPAGTASNQLPMGMQLIGRLFDEPGLFAAASLLN